MRPAYELSGARRLLRSLPGATDPHGFHRDAMVGAFRWFALSRARSRNGARWAMSLRERKEVQSDDSALRVRGKHEQQLRAAGTARTKHGSLKASNIGCPSNCTIGLGAG